MLKSNWEKTFVFIFTFIFYVNLTTAATYPYNGNYSKSPIGFSTMDGRILTYLNNTVRDIRDNYSEPKQMLVITPAGDSGFPIQSLNKVFNARREYGQSRYDFSSQLPFNAKTSVAEYFNDQSSGIFQIYATIIELEDEVFNDLENNFLGSVDGQLILDRIRDAVDEAYGDEFVKNFDLTYIIKKTALFNEVEIINDSSGFGNTCMYLEPNNDLMVRNLVYAVANSICRFPPTYHSHLAGFCLMAEDLEEFDEAAAMRIGDHPPSINPYYKLKAGWISEVKIDQHTKIRAGVLHEGPTVYTYEPERKDMAYYTQNEIFMIETRQNRGYESGYSSSGTRGIEDPNPIEPRTGIAPGNGLIVYQIYEGNPDGSYNGISYSANIGWYGRVLDSRLSVAPANLPPITIIDGNNETITQAFYPSYTYEALSDNAIDANTYPWLTYPDGQVSDASFREQELVFTQVTGAGAYNASEQPNPAGGYHHQAMNPNGTVDTTLTGEDKYFILPWTNWPEPLSDFADYNPANTLPGQFNSNGIYVPSGQYVLASAPLDVQAIKVDPSQLIREPNGIGYYDAQGNYAPGGGYEPQFNDNGSVTFAIRRVRGEGDDGLNDQTGEIEPTEFGVGTARIIYDADGRAALDLAGRTPDDENYTPADDAAGTHMYTYGSNKSFISNDTAPALEFVEYFDASTNIRTEYRYEVPATELDKILPVFSDISSPLRTMTFEVCNNMYYKGGEHGAPAGSNGFISYKFQNGLGVTGKGGQIDEPIYDEDDDLLSPAGSYVYEYDVVIDYFDKPNNIVVGIWNSGGQYTDYEVVEYDSNIAKLLGDDGKGRLTNRSKTLEFELTLEDWVEWRASDLPIEKKLKIAQIEWEQLIKPGMDFTLTHQADIYINLVVKSPAQILTGGNPSFENNEIEVEGTVHLEGPIYAKKIRKYYYIFNHDPDDEDRGGSLLKTWSIAASKTTDGKHPIEFISPSTNSNNINILWTGGFGLTTDQIVLEPKQFNKGLDDSNLIRWSEIYIYSENTDINTSAGDPDAPGQQKVLVHTSITCRPPESPDPRFLDYAQSELLANEEVEKEEVGVQNLSVSSARATLIFDDIEDVDLYAIYKTKDKNTKPKDTDFYRYMYSSTADNLDIIGLSIDTPANEETDYYWMRSVAVNDQDLEDTKYQEYVDAMEENELREDFGQPIIPYYPNLEQFERDNPTNVFLGDFSQPASVSREGLIAPTDVEATTTYINQIELTWSFNTHKYAETELIDETEFFRGNSYDYYTDNFKIYRNTSKSFNNATEIPLTIVATDERPLETEEISTRTTLIYDLGPYVVYYKAIDYTAQPYPQSYYYWVVTVDDEGKMSDPSPLAHGRRAEDVDYYLPIIDDIDDEDNDFVTDTTGTVSSDTRTVNGKTETSLKLQGDLTRGSTNTSYFDASITHEFDFTNEQDSEIVMSFDYKFEDAQKGGFLQAIINGAVVYTAFASEETVNWSNTGLIDISFAAGHKISLQIGLVCDIDDPTQALWLDRLFVGGQLVSPRWELISTPIIDQKLSDFMLADYDKDSSIYKWDCSVVNEDGSHGKYVSEPADDFVMTASEGYWIYLSEALTDDGIDITKVSSYESSFDSALNNVKTGWSLAGPIKDLYLQDRDAVKNPDSEAHYLDEYPGISVYTNVPNGHTADLNDTMPGRALSVMIWEWDAKDNCYRQVFDKLESGKAYWIFKL